MRSLLEIKTQASRTSTDQVVTMNPFSTRETILVVDASASLREIIEMLLVGVGYDVITAANAAEALQVARDIPNIDMLLSGVDMPGMTGDELANRFARIHPSAAVVLFSDLSSPIDTVVPFDFLPLPFTVAELRDAVRCAFRTTPAFEESELVASL